MKQFLFVLLIFISVVPLSAQELNNKTDDNETVNTNNINNGSKYYDFGSDDGITIYADRPKDEFPPDTVEHYILEKLSGYPADQKSFIENDFLEKAGFRRTGDIKFRRSTGGEKAMSVLHGIIHPFSFGIVPMKPFFETEYERLPDGEFYKFKTILVRSEYMDISPEVLTVMELEYMLQIEFCGGTLSPNHNINYYTEENINKFEKLALDLPEYPESIKRLKERYLHVELERIKSALERYKNPSENYVRALENLGDSLKIWEKH
ncbi:MAG: hypothetical protein LBP93_05785 [Treponema sp.]|jgi:hypothetical protein|nr:hypothetical protein [Treponema sp.]